MRKLTIVLAVAALASTAGCSRCRNLSHKGSPCGTLMSAPAVLSAPVAMSGPVMQPNMCVPCDPCMQYDPCATTGVSTGYFGGYMPNTDCACDANGATVVGPATSLPASGSIGYPAPAAQ